MARRRRLEAPSPEDLAELEQGFAAKPAGAGPGLSPPIAQVARETANMVELADADSRARAAQQASEAERYRAAQGEGRVVIRLPLDAIRIDHLSRDRLHADPDAMAELTESLRLHGQRQPIEVVDLNNGEYGLISGWRRLTALAGLAASGNLRQPSVLALVRQQDAQAAYTAMVEENEIRADLSPYERGRVAVVAVGQGAFADIDAAVSALFAAASKAKRSKIRSFALVHEELGDLLSFGPDLSEKQGLALAAGLRGGAASELRAALAEAGAGTPAEEWSALNRVLKARPAAKGPQSGGRPRRAPQAEDIAVRPGTVLRRETDPEGGTTLRLLGSVAADEVDAVVADILRRLGTP